MEISALIHSSGVRSSSDKKEEEEEEQVAFKEERRRIVRRRKKKKFKGINYWYVMIRKGMTVTYDDFINHISSKEYYDANHVIALLNDDEIDALIEQYSVEI